MSNTYKGRRVLVSSGDLIVRKTTNETVTLRQFAEITWQERYGIKRQEKRDSREKDAALIAAYLAKGKSITRCKADPPKGQFLGTFGKKRVYSPVTPGSIYEKKARAITSQQFSRG